MARAEPYKLGTCPPGVLRLTAAVDTQADRLEMLLQATVYEKLGYHDFEEFFANTRPLMKDPKFRALFEEVRKTRLPETQEKIQQ